MTDDNIQNNMTETSAQAAEERAPVGNLTDYVSGTSKDNPLHVEVAIADDGRVVVFHDKPFTTAISWFEFDLGSNKFDFVMEEGELRNFGMPLDPAVAKHMQNSHQILMVYLDDETGDAVEGSYIPLILHRS